MILISQLICSYLISVHYSLTFLHLLLLLLLTIVSSTSFKVLPPFQSRKTFLSSKGQRRLPSCHYLDCCSFVTWTAECLYSLKTDDKIMLILLDLLTIVWRTGRLSWSAVKAFSNMVFICSKLSERDRLSARFHY